MNETIKDYLTVLFGAGISRGIAFVNSIIIARLLGVEDFGRFSIFFIVMVLTWMFPQSFDSVFVRYAKTAKDNNEKTEFLRISLFLKLVYAVIVCLLSYPVAYMLAHYAFKKPDITNVLVLAMFSGVFQSFLMTIASIFQEREKFMVFSFLYASYTLAIFLLLIAAKFIFNQFSFSSIVWIHTGVSLIIGTLSLHLLFRKKIKLIWPLHPELFLKTFHLSKWVFGGVVLFFIFNRIDMFFLGRYANYDQIGVYSAASQILIIFGVILGSLNNVFMPKASVAVLSRNALKKYLKDAYAISIIVISFALFIIIFSGPLVGLLYGVKYAGSAVIVKLLLAGFIFYIAYLPCSLLFYGFSAMNVKFFMELAKLCVACILLSIFIPKFQLVGAACVMSFCFFIEFIVGGLILRRMVLKIR